MKQGTNLNTYLTHTLIHQGGPTLFTAEVEALLQIAKAGGSSWRFYEGEGANLAWALATCRHWSRRLEDLEEGLVQVCCVCVLLVDCMCTQVAAVHQITSAVSMNSHNPVSHCLLLLATH